MSTVEFGCEPGTLRTTAERISAKPWPPQQSCLRKFSDIFSVPALYDDADDLSYG